MSHARGLWKFEVAAVAAFGLALVCFWQEFKAQDVTAEVEREVYERKSNVTPQDRIAMMRPLYCDATMCARQSILQDCLPRTRCYSRSDK